MPDALLTFIYKSSSDGLSVSYMSGSCEAKFDGKDYPAKAGPNLNAVSLTKVNDRSFIETYKRDGKIVQVVHDTLSADGKTITSKIENREKGTTNTAMATKQ